eukprot:scaffold7228_cov523-Prasinococcus_capsulatus_cf.AAC.8
MMVVEEGLGALADARHDRHSLHRVSSSRRLPTKHHAVTSIQHRIGHVCGLCPRRSRIVDHRLEHLRGRHHGFARQVALLDLHMLRHEDGLRRDLHAEVTASDHDAVGLLQDVVEVLQALLVLHLGNDLHVLALLAEHLADGVQVGALAHEGGGHEVDVVLEAPVLDVVDVLLREGGQVHLHAGEVHVLALANLSGIVTLHIDGLSVVAATEHREVGTAVGAEDLIPGLHVSRQVWVGAGQQSCIALDAVVCCDCDGGALLQNHRLTSLEKARADLRPLFHNA